MSNVLIVNFKNNVKWRGTVDRETAIHLKTSFQQIPGWAWTELAWIELEECSSSELNKWIIHRCKPVMIGYPSTVDTVNQNEGALQTLARLHKHWTQNHWKKKSVSNSVKAYTIDDGRNQAAIDEGLLLIIDLATGQQNEHTHWHIVKHCGSTNAIWSQQQWETCRAPQIHAESNQVPDTAATSCRVKDRCNRNCCRLCNWHFVR